MASGDSITDSSDSSVDVNNAVSAKIKGTDEENDLAVIAVEKSDIPEETMNEIKIDMSFIKGILNNEKQQMLVKNIVNFARSTNMKSCIEGVEDKSLQDYLRSFGATWFQGYYYSKPVGEEQLKKLLLEEMYNKKDAS